MQTIKLETKIAAPLERCFLLSLSIDLHTESAAQTGERAIAGVTHGIIGLGETVTWRGRHFGLMLTHETVISKYERPAYFQDAMIRGAFKAFVHDHFFLASDGGTLMRDELRFASPFGLLGQAVDALVLRRYLTGLLLKRNDVIRTIAEAPEETWSKYLILSRRACSRTKVVIRCGHEDGSPDRPVDHPRCEI